MSIQGFFATYWQILLIFCCITNVVGFLWMGVDKKRAQSKQWRIPESTLWLSALLGGAFGAYWGMQHYRHKTLHWTFRFGMPSLMFLQGVGLLWLLSI